jgi:hypothetical protein
VHNQGGNPYIAFDSLDENGWTMGMDHVDSWKLKVYNSNLFKTGLNALTIDRNGNIGIGTQSPQYPLHVIGDVYATNIISYSDRTYKTDIQTLQKSLDIVNSIRGVSYKLCSDLSKTYIGVIAQEVEAHIPHVVHTDVNGMKSVSYGNMVGILIEAVKELTAITEKQGKEIEALKLALQPNSHGQ